MRVALIAGTLGRGGTERQLLYMARSLRAAGVDLRICCLTNGEYYEKELQQLGIATCWVGRFSNPLVRLGEIVRRLAGFRPHVIQSSHSFANLYAALAARALGASSVGALRCELRLSARDNGRWTKWLLRLPDALIVNSRKVRDELVRSGAVASARVFYVANSVDRGGDHVECDRQDTIALVVGRLVPEKRLDCFLRALAIARARAPLLRGVVVGDGPELAPMRMLAAELGLAREHVDFLGMRDDLPKWLAEADMLVNCSESEGSPNVVLEAMAAGLPVITTPAGDADLIVRNGSTGYVVPFGDVAAIAERMVTLAGSAALRRSLGDAGREMVKLEFAPDRLADRLLAVYRAVAARKCGWFLSHQTDGN
jgi:glycosyltransferase involved in cell wall biosynthesis